MADKQGEIMLSLPADKDYVLLARMVLSGLGMLAGMDVGLIDDLRTATNECCDCLLHQPMKAERLERLQSLLIEQQADLALSIADYGFVLLNGKIVLEGSARHLAADSGVQEAYLGKAQ